jgi:hypothetical protein
VPIIKPSANGHESTLTKLLRAQSASGLPAKAPRKGKKEKDPSLPNTQRDNGSERVHPSHETLQNKRFCDEALSCGVLDPLGKSVKSLPVDAFPKALQRFTRSVAAALPCPVDFIGTMILAVLSVFIGRKCSLQIKPGWMEYPVLWIVPIARSGDRKSPALDQAAAPLRKKQAELWAEYLKAKREHQKDKRAPKPVLTQILTTDTTIEALKVVLAGNPNGIIFPADELSGWARAMSQYKAGRGDDRQHWLSIWSGSQIVCNRKSEPEPIIIDHPFVSVVGCIQPDALTDLIDDAREDGFSARILFSYPDPIPKTDWTEDIVDAREYFQICETLWNLKPEVLEFSPTAKALWISWVNAHRQEAPPDNLKPIWAKAEGHCARLALVLFLARWACNETSESQIDKPSMEGAIKLISYFKSHAFRVYGSTVDHKDQSRIGKALRWIKRHGGTVTARKVSMYGVCKSSDEAKELFNDLTELGYGTVVKEIRDSVVFHLNETTGQQKE